MAEDLHITTGLSREDTYQEIIPQIKALITHESDLIANLANIAAALKEALGFFWIGFYIVKGDELVLGPFQGPVACTRIRKGKGVCGTAWAEKKTILVPDVDAFPGHIACSSQSKSEIVVPAIVNGEVALVLDVDSENLNDFTDIDTYYLNDLIKSIESLIS
ncbi:MAG: GAF domain-containing protein [Cyclobacteriaceae bacterium]|nr:GAF domain-containing protein [Cyclobacteriaceae bacterium]